MSVGRRAIRGKVWGTDVISKQWFERNKGEGEDMSGRLYSTPDYQAIERKDGKVQCIHAFVA